MAILASYTNKTDSLENAFVIPATAPVQFFLYGQLGTEALVKVLIKTDDGVFTEFPETTFSKRAAAILYLKAGDEVRIQFIRCLDASAEFRQ